MHLLLLLSLWFFSLALGSHDVLYINKLNADQARATDKGAYSEFEYFFTKTAHYNFGGAGLDAYGIPNITAGFVDNVPAGAITVNLVSTESVTLLPPFDDLGAAGKATGVQYKEVVFVGQGKYQGQSYTAFGKYDDKYVKTGDFARYGGWRISERIFTYFVSCPKAE